MSAGGSGRRGLDGELLSVSGMFGLFIYLFNVLPHTFTNLWFCTERASSACYTVRGAGVWGVEGGVLEKRGFRREGSFEKIVLYKREGVFF